VDDGEYDGLVLAVAGLARLGWTERAAQVFEPAEMLPAVGQGALAVQVRTDDLEALAVVAAADDAATRIAITAERAFERRLGGGCHSALAAYATLLEPSSAHGPTAERTPVLLRGLVGEPAGRLLRGEMEGVAGEADMLGVRLAEFLIAQGAEEMLGAAQ
jgi:hydroxymethylbilane synthase